MKDYEIIHQRGQETLGVWGQFAPTFVVGKLTMAQHETDLADLLTAAEDVTNQQDVVDTAAAARDANYTLITDLNTRAPMAIEGALEAGDPLLKDVKDVRRADGRSQEGAMTRGRMVISLWRMYNTRLAAQTPPGTPLLVGGKALAILETAVGAHPALLQALDDQQSDMNSKQSWLRKQCKLVDKDNKRWFKAWSGNFPVGTAEHDALSQIDTDTQPVAVVAKAQIVHAYFVATGRKAHLDMACEHATRFQILRKPTGAGEFVVVADKVTGGTFEDPNLAAGSYDYQVVGSNSREKGEASDPATVVAP